MCIPCGMAKVLAVDDSLTMLQQLEVFLCSHGYEVTTARSARDGLTAAKRTAFDLCIVDVNMPVMNGLQMIGELRKQDGYAETPVFVLTTESTPNLVTRGREAGATAWIVKPFKHDLLLQGIRKVLEP